MFITARLDSIFVSLTAVHMYDFHIFIINCFIIKNPLNSLHITLDFQNKPYLQSEQQCRQHVLCSHKARYKKPIRIPLRMVQVIGLAIQD